MTILVVSAPIAGARVDLLRLKKDGELFESHLLHSRNESRNQRFAFTQITGGVDVKSACLGSSRVINFCRLDVNEPRMEIFHSTSAEHVDSTKPSVYVSKSGEELYAISTKDPKLLHVYSLKDNQWTTATIDMGDWKPKVSYFLSEFV